MIGFHHKEAAVNGKDSKIERGVERCNQFYNEMKFRQIQSLYIWRKSHCWPSMNAIRILKLFSSSFSRVRAKFSCQRQLHLR